MPALKPALVLDQESAEDNDPVPLKLRNTYFASVPALLFILVLGYMSSYPAPATVDMKAPGSRFRDITADEITWIASLPMISGIFGNAFSGEYCIYCTFPNTNNDEQLQALSLTPSNDPPMPIEIVF